MFLKLLKQGLLTTILVLLLSAMIPRTFAMDYAVHEIDLNQGFSVVQENRLFNAISVQADEEIEDLMVNFGNGWQPVEIHDHGYGPEALVFSSPAHTVQFKSDDPVKLKTHLFYYEPEPEVGGPEVSNLSDLYVSTQLVARDLSVISRSEWGADESLRYWTPEKEEASKKDESDEEPVDPCAGMEEKYASELGLSYVKEYSPGGDLLTWPLQYMKRVRKIVIHHTDSEIRDMNGDSRTDNMDYKAMVRAIYQYHALSRGWGDIGYNYIIDPLGNIYEGRYGGDRVIGAHSLCYNNGAMGIAVIGNYASKAIPEPALNSLISLVALKSKEHSIDPAGYSDFRGERLPNILGHRDLRSTSCPGAQLYSLLPKIRQRASLAIRSGAFQESGLQLANLDYNAQPLTDFGNIVLRPNERKTVTLRFKNTGKQSWDHNTWMHVALNNNPQARVVPVIEDKVFVAADLKERSVAPGQTGSFDVMVEGGYYAGHYSFQVAPVVNGRYKVSRAIVNLSFNVEAPNYSYEVVDQDFPSGTVFQGERIQAWIDIRNTGNVIWKNHGENQITLGTSSPRDRKSIFIENNPSRLGYLYESEIRPGQIGHFVMDLQIPAYRTGLTIEQFTPVIEKISWMQDKALGFRVDIKEPRHLARITKLNNIGRLLPGEMFKLELQMENIGDLAWDMDNMEVTFLNRGLKVFKNHLVPLEPVAPGEKVNFDFWVQAPYQEGYHSIFLRSYFNDVPIKGGTARYAIQVPNPIMRAQLVDRGSEYVTIRPGQEKEITVKFKNVGNVIWRNKGPNVIHLGSSAPRDRLSNLYYEDGWENKYRSATLNETIVRPGGIGTFTFTIKPENKGIYREGFQLVIENVGWIFESSVNWIFRVFGDRVESSTSLSDSEINKERISIITPTTTTTTTPTVTETSEPAYTPPTVTERPFRVKLSYSDENSVLTSDKNFIVTDADNNELFTLLAGEEIDARRLENNIHAQVGDTVKSASVIRLIPEEGGIMEIKTWENRPAWNRSLNDNRFRGTIEIRVVNGQVAYINELPLGDYLKGLAEVSNDAHFEKQKTIAVLARTYARFYMEDDNRKFPGLPYDGSDDPAVFQRYLGYGYEARSPSFAGAVLITKDEVVTYQGKLVKTPYFNQSDGRTRSAKEVWGWTDTPYLQSVADPWCEGRYKRGHGVGLSGFGASSQANEGKTYDEIIKYYYQGVEVEELNFQ